jgi:hypothetical protein
MNRTKIEAMLKEAYESEQLVVRPSHNESYLDGRISVLKELLAEDEGWISVEERLPEKMQDILFSVVGVKNMKNEPIPPTVHYGWLDLANGFRSYIDPRDRWLATHWMPLPKAPSQPQKGAGV